jgi:methyl-accepting chemotaxis protein-1 (serine sensor receptor)
MKVKVKLIFVIGTMTVLMAAMAVFALFALSTANERLDTIVNGVNAHAALAAEMRAAVNRRAIAARNLILVKRPEDLAQEKIDVMQAHHDVNDKLAKLKQATSAPEIPENIRAKVAEIDGIERKYGPVAIRIVEWATTGKHDEAIASMNDDCRPLLKALLGAVGSYLDLTTERAKQMIVAAKEDYAQQRLIFLSLCAFALLAAGGLGWSLIRNLLQALGTEPAELNAVALRVAQGDLNPVIGADKAPATSVLAALGNMQQNLAQIVGQVRNTSDSIATGSAQIATGNADLSQRTEEQASNLQQTSASMMEIRSTVEKNAVTAHQANQLAASASQAAQDGGSVMREVVSTMQDITTSSKKVADIITVIDGIAFQTNILALNAAVEAARAGEQGRGFAVVAGEVRTLAQRSAEAAKEIKSLIGASVERVESGSRLVENAGASIDAIVDQVRKVAHFIEEISATAVEQTTTIGQVTDAVGQLDQVTQQNAALVEESAAAAESLKHQAVMLAGLVGQFRVTEEGASLTATSRELRHAQPKANPTSSAAVTKGSMVSGSVARKAAEVKEEDWASF